MLQIGLYGCIKLRHPEKPHSIHIGSIKVRYVIIKPVQKIVALLFSLRSKKKAAAKRTNPNDGSLLKHMIKTHSGII